MSNPICYERRDYRNQTAHRNGWKVFEAPGVEPVFLQKDQAINNAHDRACGFAPARFAFRSRPAMSSA